MIACSTGTLLIQSKLPDNLECVVVEAFVIPILPCHTSDPPSSKFFK